MIATSLDYWQKHVLGAQPNSGSSALQNTLIDTMALDTMRERSTFIHPNFVNFVASKTTLDDANNGQNLVIDTLNTSDISVTVGGTFDCTGAFDGGSFNKVDAIVINYTSGFKITPDQLRNIESNPESTTMYMRELALRCIRRIKVAEQADIVNAIDSNSSTVYTGSHPFAGSTVSLNATIAQRTEFLSGEFNTDIADNLLMSMKEDYGAIFLGDSNLNKIIARVKGSGTQNSINALQAFVSDGIEMHSSSAITRLLGSSVTGYLILNGVFGITSWARPQEELVERSADLADPFIRYTLNYEGDVYEIQIDRQCNKLNANTDARKTYNIQVKKTGVYFFAPTRADGQSGIIRYNIAATI